MSKILKFALIGILLVLAALWIYIESYRPQLEGKIEMASIDEPVKVYYDTYGIPHIYAENAADAYRAFGWVHASDRLFQMEMMRRVGNGQLSEIFGPDLKKADAFFRTLGTHRKAKADAERFKNLPSNIKKVCVAYIAGVNDYIKNGKLPMEFKLLGIQPKPYTVSDMYAIEGYMAFTFAYSLRTDPVFEQIFHQLGIEYLKDFDWGYPQGVQAEIVSDATGDSGVANTKNRSFDFVLNLLKTDFLDNLPVPILEGSNSWVLSPSRTASGAVIFANDTHIKYASPSVWYEAHIQYPGFEIYGNFLAGIPFALIGHSRHHAWGITMFEEDDSDFFNEKFAQADSSATIYRDSLTAPVIKLVETIKVKDEKDTLFTVYNTVHGPIINAFLPDYFDSPVSMYWNYMHIENNLLEAFYKMNYATDMESFREGVARIGAPGLNVCYGDAAGNIAMWSAAKLIKRADGEYGKRFADGFASADAYEGFYAFAKNPKIINPEKGYLYSANQYHDSTTGIAYPGYYAPMTRYNRIGNRLRTMFPATVGSMKSLATDVVSKTAAKLSHEIAETIKPSNAELSSIERQALGMLSKWDGNHRLQDQEPTIFYPTLYFILQKAMRDELGTDLLNALDETHLLLRMYPKFLMRGDSNWWDNIASSDGVETRAEIFTAAFKKAVENTRKQLGDEVDNWNWSRVHFIVHPHPFGKKDILAAIFNVGPFAAPGGIETVNNAGFTLNGRGEYIASYGPAMRIIIDFADVENAISILPTGNSGNRMSPHYNDQAEMYIAGEFRKMLMNKAEIDSVSTLVELVPKL